MRKWYTHKYTNCWLVGRWKIDKYKYATGAVADAAAAELMETGGGEKENKRERENILFLQERNWESKQKKKKKKRTKPAWSNGIISEKKQK